MHELSIALGIVRIAEKACTTRQARRVDVIELEIGELSGIEPSSLQFAWPLAVRETRLEHAEKIIDWVKGKGQCLECGKQFDLHTLYDSCPKCKGYFKEVIAGKELRVKSLIVS